MAKYLEHWVEDDISSVLQSKPTHRRTAHKLFLLSIYPEEQIAIVTDSKVRITVIFTNLDEKRNELFQSLDCNDYIDLEDYYFGTFLQSNIMNQSYEHLEHLGIGFPLLIICSSFSITTGKFRKSIRSFIEINESPAIKNILPVFTFSNLFDILQKQNSFSYATSPHYSSSYALLAHHCHIPHDQLEYLSTLDATGTNYCAQPLPISDDPAYPSFPLPVPLPLDTATAVDGDEKKSYPLRNRGQKKKIPSTSTGTSSTAATVAATSPSTPIKTHAHETTHKTTPSSLFSMNCFHNKLTEDCLMELKRWFSRRSGTGTTSEHHPNAQSPFKDSVSIMKQWQQESAQKKRALETTAEVEEEDSERRKNDNNGKNQSKSKSNKKKTRVEDGKDQKAENNETEKKTAADVPVQHFVEDGRVKIPTALAPSSSPVKQPQKPAPKAQTSRRKRNQAQSAPGISQDGEMQEAVENLEASARKATDNRTQEKSGDKSSTSSLKKTAQTAPSSTSSSASPAASSSLVVPSASAPVASTKEAVKVVTHVQTNAQNILLNNSLSSSAQVALKSYLGIA